MTLDTPVAVLNPLAGGDYTKDSVKVLQDAAHIRQRPGMYIGDTGAKGLHHLVYELVYNSVDEALAGYCKHIGVTIKVDGSCSVVDDGRGIPVDIHPHANRPTLEVVLTTVGAGAKFDNAAYKGLGIALLDERTGKKETFHYEGGIAEFVAYLNRNDEVLHAPIYLDKTIDRVRVEVALQYTTGEEERSRAYANNAFNPGGGTHMSGFRSAITRTLNSYGSKENLFKNDVQPIGEDFREG